MRPRLPDVTSGPPEISLAILSRVRRHPARTEGVRARRRNRCYFGNPNTRSPMMLRWTSEVPPPMVRAVEKRNP